MKKIAAIVLLYVIATLPAFAADNDAHALSEPDAGTPPFPALDALKSEVARLSSFKLLQVSDSFSLYGKLSVPRITAAEVGAHRSSATYGLRGQLGGRSRVDIRFGWDRYIAGQYPNDNLYSLTATVDF